MYRQTVGSPFDRTAATRRRKTWAPSASFTTASVPSNIRLQIGSLSWTAIHLTSEATFFQRFYDVRMPPTLKSFASSMFVWSCLRNLHLAISSQASLSFRPAIFATYRITHYGYKSNQKAASTPSHYHRSRITKTSIRWTFVIFRGTWNSQTWWWNTCPRNVF